MIVSAKYINNLFIVNTNSTFEFKLKDFSTFYGRIKIYSCIHVKWDTK